MKLHDFGLWFQCLQLEEENSKKNVFFFGCRILYHGFCVGKQFADYSLSLSNKTPFMLSLKDDYPMIQASQFNVAYHYDIDRLITAEDFEIIENPNYRGD